MNSRRSIESDGDEMDLALSMLLTVKLVLQSTDHGNVDDVALQRMGEVMEVAMEKLWPIRHRLQGLSP